MVFEGIEKAITSALADLMGIEGRLLIERRHAKFLDMGKKGL